MTLIWFPQNVQSASREALLYVFEDNEAVIKMIMKGRRLRTMMERGNPLFAVKRITCKSNLEECLE